MPDAPCDDRRASLWRAFVPRWAHEPLSGEGAARFGGRWNSVGRAGALCGLRAFHGLGRIQSGLRSTSGADRAARACRCKAGRSDATPRCSPSLAWTPAFTNANGAPTSIAAPFQQPTNLRETLARPKAFDGVVYPSFMSPGGTCVALWRWNAPGAPSLKVIDPEGRLPKAPLPGSRSPAYPCPMFTSRPAARIDTEKPDNRSTSAITISVKNTECAAPLTSRNSTRKATKTKVESRWSTTDAVGGARRLHHLDEQQDQPITTSTSPSVMVKTPPDIIANGE